MKCVEDVWNYQDDVLWREEKMVMCPRMTHSFRFRLNIDEDPPEGCPYALEHMVAMDDEEIRELNRIISGWTNEVKS